MKRIITTLIIISIFVSMIGCTSQSENADLSVSDSQAVEETNQTEKAEENTKTLADFLPTYEEYYQSLLDSGLTLYEADGEHKIIDGDDVYYITYKMRDTSAIYSVSVFCDNNKRAFKIKSTIVDYPLTFEPFQVYLKNIPNALTTDDDMKLIKTNGIRSFEDATYPVGTFLNNKKAVYEYKKDGISYNLKEAKAYSKVSCKYVDFYEIEVNIDRYYKVI